MREIKFRAFYEDYGDPERPNGSMFYHTALNPDGTWLLSFDGGETYDGDWVGGEDIEIMQFTGLKDKNGKEIYEKDIVQVYSISGNYIAYDFVVEIPDIYTKASQEYLEVIGNIYENQELVK